MSTKLKRIATDAGGYGLILAGILTGWLPGPGGIPLILGGLALLSINNAWARRLRDFLIREGGSALKKLFPEHPFVQAAWDLLALALLVIVVWLSLRHAAIWQLSLAIALFFGAIVVAGINRDRLPRLKQRLRRK